MYCPCENCQKEFDNECITFCDYARNLKILEKVILSNEPCAVVCKNGYPCRGVGYDCDFYDECISYSLFKIDFEKIIREYDIDFNMKNN